MWKGLPTVGSATPEQGVLGCIKSCWERKKKAPRLSCRAPAQSQTWQVWFWGLGLGLKGVNISIPGTTAFAPEEAEVISPKAAVCLVSDTLEIFCFPCDTLLCLAFCWLCPIFFSSRRYCASLKTCLVESTNLYKTSWPQLSVFIFSSPDPRITCWSSSENRLSKPWRENQQVALLHGLYFSFWL